jgi:hypothetical protein
MSIFVQLEKNQTRKKNKNKKTREKVGSKTSIIAVKGREGKQQQLASMREEGEREREREHQQQQLLPT